MKEPVKERFSLPVRLNAESAIAIAMPESKAIHFLASVIQTPSDVEVGSVLLDKTVPVIGRMNVAACDAYWTTCKENPSYDVVWWRLELAEDSSEWESCEGVRGRSELTQFLSHFVPDKRIGVLETVHREKGFYFLLLLLASPLQGGRGRRAAVPHIQKDICFQFPHCQTENPEKHHNGKGHSGSQDPVPAFITVITFPGKKGGNLLIIISHLPHLTFPSSIRIIRSAI